MEEAVGLKYYTDGGGIITSRVNPHTDKVITFTPPQNEAEEAALRTALGEDDEREIGAKGGTGQSASG